MSSATGSLGVRGTTMERWLAPRSVEEVDVDGLPVRVKVSPGRIKAEHDDVSRVARATGLPLMEVASRAEQAWRERVGRSHSHHPAAGPEPPFDPGDEPA